MNRTQRVHSLNLRDQKQKAAACCTLCSSAAPTTQPGAAGLNMIRVPQWTQHCVQSTNRTHPRGIFATSCSNLLPDAPLRIHYPVYLFSNLLILLPSTALCCTATADCDCAIRVDLALLLLPEGCTPNRTPNSAQCSRGGGLRALKPWPPPSRPWTCPSTS